MTKPLVRVAEWQPVTFPAALDTPRIKDRIVRAGYTRHGAAFSQRAQLLKARDLVGLVSTRDIDIQIIPKLYVDDTDAIAGAVLMRTMLGIELAFPHHLTFANTAYSRDPFLELVIGHLARTLLAELEDAVPRRYFEKSEELSVIRGRVDLQYQARQMPSYAHKILVRHAPLQRDNPLSQLCKAIAATLLNVSATARHKRILMECLDLLGDVSSVQISMELLLRATPSRLETSWEWVFRIGELLIAGRATDLVSAGDQGGVAILFPLDGLFEGLIRRSVSRGLQGTDYFLSRSKNIGRLFRRVGSSSELTELRPDLVVRKTGSSFPCGVGDAKWKRQKPNKPFTPERSDAFQLLTYMGKLGLSQGFLCYPAAAPVSNVCKIERVETTNGGARLSLIEVDVAQLAHPDESVRSHAERALATLVVSTC